MDLVESFRYVAALIFVLSLIALLAWAVRRFGLAGYRPVGGPVRRLRIVETMALDAKRRLVLFRRDGVEHLVLLGERETVIESGLVAPPAPPIPANGSNGL